MMAFVDDDKCAEYGLDPKMIGNIARRLSKAAQDASDLGLTVFGGAGSGDLRRMTAEQGGSNTIVATLNGRFDGGCGGDEF